MFGHPKSRDGKWHWWVNSRGTNDLENYSALVLIGVACRNLSDLEAEFTILYGRSPQEGTEQIKYPIQVKGQLLPDVQRYFEMEESAAPEYRLFCRRRILADIHQAFGRLRSHRHPHQQLKIYFIGDYPLDVAVTLRKASDITPEVATKTERLVNLMKACFKWMCDRGIKITQSSSARVSQELDPNSKGYSQQYLSKYWKMLSSLIGFVLNQPSTNPVSPEELESVGDSALGACWYCQ